MNDKGHVEEARRISDAFAARFNEKECADCLACLRSPDEFVDLDDGTTKQYCSTHWGRLCTKFDALGELFRELLALGMDRPVATKLVADALLRSEGGQ